MNQFPFSETIGVFLGISGFDWLSEGYPEPIKAIAIAAASGLALFFLKQIRQR